MDKLTVFFVIACVIYVDLLHPCKKGLLVKEVCFKSLMVFSVSVHFKLQVVVGCGISLWDIMAQFTTK